MAIQVKKNTPNFTDAQLDDMAKKAGEQVKIESDKVKIRIPFDKLNPKDLAVPVCINGYIWQINRGEYVEVPKAVADVLSEAGYI